MAIMMIATRIIQELIVHVTMAEKSRIMRARAVRMSSFEGDFHDILLFSKIKNEIVLFFSIPSKTFEEQLVSRSQPKLFFAGLLPAEIRDQRTIGFTCGSSLGAWAWP